jgi:LacI family transcriptional regulator
MSVRDWSNFACPNPDCSLYGQRGQKNLRPHGWSSKSRDIRCLRCTECGKNFSERKGTPLFGIHMNDQKALSIAQHLIEGNGMRPTSRLCGVTLNTVLRFAHKAGKHAQLFHDQMVQHVQPQQVQADEAWSYVGKKRQEL